MSPPILGPNPGQTNLRKLLVEEQLPLAPEPEREPGRVTRIIDVVAYDNRPGQMIMTISEDGEAIIAVNQVKRFFPPLVEYQGPDDYVEIAVQQRILALLEASARTNAEPVDRFPEMEAKDMEAFFRDRLRLKQEDSLRLITDDGDELDFGERFVVKGLGITLAVRGQPGVCLTTPRGVGLFINDVTAVVGAALPGRAAVMVPTPWPPSAT